MLAGSTGEEVTITALRPGAEAAQHDWTIVQQSVVFHADEVKTVSFSAFDSVENAPAFV